MADELIDAVEEVVVCLALEVERGGAEAGRVHPGPNLGGDHGPAVQVRGRGGPSGLGDLAPAPALTLEQVCKPVATDGGRRSSVALDPERHAASGRPALTSGDEVLLVELDQSALVVGAEPRCVGSVDGEPIQDGQ